MNAKLIAFCGYGGAGKDEAAKTLIQEGYQRVAFGDIIKGIFDPLVQKFLGFSAFTEDRFLKPKIRPLLEQGGEVFYDYVFGEFFSDLPDRAVNTRLCRPREAKEWVRRGGVIVEVIRPGLGPDTEWSHKVIESLRAEGLITCQLQNDGTLEDLDKKVRLLFGMG